MKRNSLRQGVPRKKHAYLDVYYLCAGPDKSGPILGERLINVIYDSNNHIVRPLEQINGDCIDEGGQISLAFP